MAAGSRKARTAICSYRSAIITARATRPQNLANHLGKIVRITPDGSAPRDNPFIGRDGAKPEIWSYGHRNPQSLAMHPTTGKLWEIEHGPRGGDEVNIPEKGKNYGWPVIGYGIDYSGAKIHEGTHKDGMEQPVKYWVPSIAPSGMAFYTGDQFPKWRGSLFTGSINSAKILVRLTLDGEKVTGEERLLQNLNEQIRDVRQGPDGAIWLLTDSPAGRILRIDSGEVIRLWPDGGQRNPATIVTSPRRAAWPDARSAARHRPSRSACRRGRRRDARRPCRRDRS